MKIKLLTLLIPVVVVILHGCANIPKQEFIEEANALSRNDKIKIPIKLPESSQYDVSAKYNQYYRKLLQEPTIISAIYDEAVIINKAWSADSILNTNWHAKLLKRGIVLLEDNDKIALMQLFSNKYSTATDSVCSDIKSNIFNLFPLYNANEADEFIRIQYNAILAGTVKTNTNVINAKKKAYVGLLALSVKVKETMSDDELGDILYAIIEKQKASPRIDCKTISKIFDLVNSLEPKYRGYLFNAVDFQ